MRSGLLRHYKNIKIMQLPIYGTYSYAIKVTIGNYDWENEHCGLHKIV